MNGGGWTLAGFIEALDRWIGLDAPGGDLRLVVTSWVLTRADDPYRGVRREAGFGNLWWGAIPGSAHGTARIVGCSYWIFEQQRLVRCDQITALGLPA